MLRTLLCCVLFVVVADAMTQASRDRLTRDLLKNYQPIVDPGNIDLEFSVMAICATFDRFTSTATANVWEYQSWKDSRLAWNPSDYSGIQTLRIPAKLLWTPDIRVYTSVSAFVQRDSDVNAVVSADGTVLYIPPTTYRLHCKDNGDTATCNTRVGSWTYDGINVVLKQHGDDGFDLSVYDDSCPALIASHSAKVVTHRYPCCPEPYPSLDLSFTVKQRQEAAGQQHGQRPEL